MIRILDSHHGGQAADALASGKFPNGSLNCRDLLESGIEMQATSHGICTMGIWRGASVTPWVCRFLPGWTLISGLPRDG